MKTKQQLAFRRAWCRCYCDLRRVEELIPKADDEFRLELLKKREEILHDDIKIFEQLIEPDEKSTSP